MRGIIGSGKDGKDGKDGKGLVYSPMFRSTHNP
jgi:hypothetical protein